MSDKVRTVVMFIVLAVWGTVVAAYLRKGQLPDAALLGVPAAVILALAPPHFGRRSSTTDTTTATNIEVEAPASEGEAP